MRLLAIVALAFLASCSDGDPMTHLTQSKESLVVRTDFTDDEAWHEVKAAIVQPHSVYGFQAYVVFVDDTQYDSLAVDRLLELIPEGGNQTFIFLVDSQTIRDPKHPVLCVDLASSE